MIFKITSAKAGKMKCETIPTDEKTPPFERWNITIGVTILNVKEERSTKHNKLMKYVSKCLIDIVEKELNLVYKLVRIYPSNSFVKDLWFGDFEVRCDENEEEALNYMVWWISSCKTREFKI